MRPNIKRLLIGLLAPVAFLAMVPEVIMIVVGVFGYGSQHWFILPGLVLAITSVIILALEDEYSSEETRREVIRVASLVRPYWR